MRNQANGIGSYKRTKSPNGVTRISDEGWARIAEAQRVCRERSEAAVTPAQAAQVYRTEAAGVPVQRVEASR